MAASQLTIDGREIPVYAPERHTQSGLFDLPPASTFEDPAPALVPGQLDTDARTHEPMRPRGCVRHRGEWS